MATAVQNRINRHRSSRSSGRPIMKRNSHSEKATSFELDRSWEDQIHYENHGWGSGTARNNSIDIQDSGAIAATASSTMNRETKYDTGHTETFDHTYGMSRTSYGSGSCFAAPRSTSYSVHHRNISCPSHTSAGTNGSGQRPFVHPFQQTPRTSSPPLFVTTPAPERSPSLRDYSPTIAETDNEAYYSSGLAFRSSSVGARASLDHAPLTYHGSRIPHSIITCSRSEVPLSSHLDSPVSPLKMSATGGGSQMSPKRSSLDMTFRLRSRSEVNTFTQRETVREARRRFEEKQRQKDEKYAREQLAKEAKEATKEAVKFEKAQAQLKKSASTAGSGRNSYEFGPASPSAAGPRRNTSGSIDAERPSNLAFAANSYDDATPGAEPTTDAESDAPIPTPRRMQTAKRRTQSTWTAFILWIRTRLFKMSRR